MIPEAVLDAVRPPRMRPALWHALRALMPAWRGYPIRHGSIPWNNFVRAKERWESEWARTPELVELGLCLVAPHQEEKVRRYGCVWLRQFPSLETVRAMEAIALDESEPRELREQAIATLGNRRLEGAAESVFWTPEVVRAADAALARTWALCRSAPEPFRELPTALRHVADLGVIDAIAEDVLLAIPALEAFASKELARRLLEKLSAVSHEHAPRIVRLIGHALGAEAADPLLSYARDAPFGGSVEALMTALALDSEKALGPVDAFLSTLKFDRVLRERSELQKANPGVVFAPRGLAVARVTAAIPLEMRAKQCREAASFFAALGKIEAFPEAYIYGMWRQVARHSNDDATIVGAAESTPDALTHGPYLVAPYLDALARRGEFKKLASAAVQLGQGAHATFLLARMGRPFMALAVRRSADSGDPATIAGEALALFMAGRPDLTTVLLEKTTPRPEPLVYTYAPATFPGPDERWRLEHEPERCGALAALAGGLATLLATTGEAPETADPDSFDFTLFAESERRLAEGKAGWSIDLPGVIDASATERFRRTTCSNCGAAKTRPSATPYVYCDYCGSLADYDLEMAGTTAQTKPNASYERLSSEIALDLERAIARGDRDGYRSKQVALFEAWVDASPGAIPPRARDPRYRTAYVAYRADCETAVAFDETSRLYDVAVKEAARAVVLVEPSPGRIRATPASFDALCRVFFPYAAHVHKMLDTEEIHDKHPDRAEAEVIKRIAMSTFVQEWLPKLDDALAKKLLERAGMKNEYIEAAPPPGEDAGCTHCGNAIKKFEGAKCVLCEACGHRLDVEGERLECAGCGAPLAPGEGMTDVSCPYCKTAMKRVPKVHSR